jgi:hypothetical protein
MGCCRERGLTGEVPPKSRQPGARRPALVRRIHFLASKFQRRSPLTREAHDETRGCVVRPAATDIANAVGHTDCCGPADCEQAPHGAIRQFVPGEAS